MDCQRRPPGTLQTWSHDDCSNATSGDDSFAHLLRASGEQTPCVSRNGTPRRSARPHPLLAPGVERVSLNALSEPPDDPHRCLQRCPCPPRRRLCLLFGSSTSSSSCTLSRMPWQPVLTPHSSSLRHARLDGVFVSITPGDPSLWVGVIFVRKGTTWIMLCPSPVPEALHVHV